MVQIAEEVQNVEKQKRIREKYSNSQVEKMVSKDFEKFLKEQKNIEAKKEAFAAELKPALIAHKYNTKRILANMQRNKVNMNAPMTEENFNTYYEKRGEVWTEGTGTIDYNKLEYVPGWGLVRKNKSSQNDEVIEENRRGGSKRRKTKKNKRKSTKRTRSRRS
jgi:hypothetical protein